MNATLDDYDTFDELFVDVEKLIWSICHDFVKKYGGSVDELFVDSGLFFMKALDKFDPTMGTSFTTVLHFTVWSGLMDTLRLTMNRQSKMQRHDEGVLHDREARSTFDVIGFKRSISKDAALIVHLLTMLPGTLEKAAHRAGLTPTACKTNKRSPKYDRVKTALIDYLLDWGWDMDRINSTFSEIEEALSGN